MSSVRIAAGRPGVCAAPQVELKTQSVRPSLRRRCSMSAAPTAVDGRELLSSSLPQADGVLQEDPLAGRDSARRTSTYVVSGCVLAWRGVLGTHRLTPVGGNLGSSIR